MFRRLILISSLALPLAVLAGWSIWPAGPWLALGGVMMIAHSLYLAGTLWPNSGWFHPAVKRFITSEKTVWLTFDDGPDPVLTPQVLALLKKHEALATFFVIGGRAQAYPHLIQAIAEARHQLANHSFTHPAGRFWAYLSPAIHREISRCNQTLTDLTGARPTLFRAPVGMVSPSLSPALKSEELTLIGWSARGFDTGGGCPTTLRDRVLRGLNSGAIILLHPERRPEALTALELLLNDLSQQGYRCVIPEATQFLTS